MEEINSCIKKMMEIVDQMVGVINDNGVVIACTEATQIGAEDYAARDFCLSDDQFLQTDDRIYVRVKNDSFKDFICFIENADDTSQAYIRLFANWLSAVMSDSSTQIDRETFLKNVLLDNILPGEIPLKSRSLKIPFNVKRAVLVMRTTSHRSSDIIESIESLFPEQNLNPLFAMDVNSVCLLKEVMTDEEEEIDNLVQKILDILEKKEMDVCIGIGNHVETLQDCAKSYHEAFLALIVGKIFKEDIKIMRYSKLGLGRLIYQLPETLCNMFLKEIFPSNSYESLDSETLITIQKFFENNLNGSETSRQLFIHRNTLIYRLDKVQKITKLDLRNFEDAVLFKLASMVRKYLENKERLLDL